MPLEACPPSCRPPTQNKSYSMFQARQDNCVLASEPQAINLSEDISRPDESSHRSGRSPAGPDHRNTVKTSGQLRAPRRAMRSFVPRPFPPPSLANVPVEYIIDQLHTLAPHYWSKPETADCSISTLLSLISPPPN